MNELGGLFDEAEGREARAAGDARLSGEEFAAVHGRVRRAHARRAALRTSLVAVAVVVLGAAGLYGISRVGAVSAADSAAPLPSGSVSASPSPSPSDTGVAWPGFAGTVTVDPHLPDAAAITPAVWASVGPGWALVSYREAWGDAPSVGPQVIYLMSPAGDRYELVNVPGDTVSVLAWEAGSATAVVSVQPDGDPPYAASMDLVTGAVTETGGYAPYIWSIAFLDADGAPVWTGNDATSAYVAIAADGTQSAYAIPAELGAAEFAKAQLGYESCGVAAPFDDDTAIVQCRDAEGGGAVVRSSESTGTVVDESGASGLSAVGPTRAGDNVIAETMEASSQCPSAYSIVQDGKVTPLAGMSDGLHPDPTVFMPFGAHLNTFTWGETSGCTGDQTPIVVVSSDLGGGDYAVLMPYPADRPAGEEPYQSVTGVAVGR
jgi:hypothetical protein